MLLLGQIDYSKRFFSQGALIISKTRNRLTKDTFEKIICLKSWGVFKDEEENKEELEKKDISLKNNLFIIENRL